MKKIPKLLVLAMCLIGAALTAQTTIPGGNVYGHWTLTGSPYDITGNVIIPADSTLTIDAGVTVRFQTSGNLGMTVKGTLLAMGTQQDTIRFFATDTTNGFHGIRFISPASTADTSRLYFCKFQYGKSVNITQDYGGALYFSNWSKAVITQCYILNCWAGSVGAGICCDSSSSPVITANTISYNMAGMGTNAWGGGAGIACRYASNPQITYNTITYNMTTRYGYGQEGAGIYCLTASPTISYNTISYNESGGSGGGIGCLSGGAPTVSYNTISFNSSFGNCGPGHGTAIYSYGTPAVITHNTITDNTTNSSSCGYGAICFRSTNSIPAITYNTIENNRNGSGGAIALENSTLAAINYNIISNNYAQNQVGGAIYLYGSTVTQVSNNSFTNNFAVSDGGTLWMNGSTITSAINNTIANNKTNTNGGAVFLSNGSNATFKNCIFWGNTAAAGSQVYINDATSNAPNFSYSDVQGGTAAFGLNATTYSGTFSANNINSDPIFVAPSSGSGASFDGVSANWGLQTGSSPCINTGDPTTNSPSFDVLGNTRVTVCRVDMGAYENQYAQPLQLSVSTVNTVCGQLCTGSASVTVTGGSGVITYSWSPGGLTTPSITNRCAGTYTVKVTEGGGCFKTSIVTINANPTMAASFVKTPVSCNAGSDGTAQVNVSNGAPAYSYQWSANAGSQTTQTASNLAAGNYTVVVTDQNSCTISPTVTVVQPTAITITKSRTNASCSNNDGAASVTPTGGTPGYTYLWSTTATTQTVSGLASGVYTVTVTDNNLCTLTDTVKVLFIPSATPAPAPICLVTVDSMSINNIIMWDKSGYAYADSFIVYREISTALYQRIGAVSKDSLSQFIDVNRLIGPANGDPNVGSYRYKLQVRDSCGNYSALSPYHNSVWFNDLHNGSFTWNQYLVEGMVNTPVANFNLRVDTNNTGFWKLVGSVAGTQTSLNDPHYFNYNTVANWRIDATGFNCSPTARYSNGAVQTTIVKSKSNISNNRSTAVDGSWNSNVNVYPNPAKDKVMVVSERLANSIQVLDVSGKILHEHIPVSERCVVDLSQLAPGVYLIKVNFGSAARYSKIVKL